MRPEDVPVLALLRQSIGFNADRQRVIAENVANANTPGYTPNDLDEAGFRQALRAEMEGRRTSTGGISMRTSDAGHIGSSGVSNSSRNWQTTASPDSETTINGNSVVLEEQMVRANETRLQYETALSLYQKSLGLMRMAVKSPGR